MSRDALIVGINKYQQIGNKCLQNLETPSKNAEEIAQLLEKYGEFDVLKRLPQTQSSDGKCSQICPNTPVRLADLKKAIVQLFHPKEGNYIPDVALLYFSGHGVYENTSGFFKGYLAAYDARTSGDPYGYSLSDLRELLNHSPIRTQIVWLDCCHSGSFISILDDAKPTEKKGFNRCFIAASREFEPAFVDVSGSYGLLTEALLYGLKLTRNSSQWVTNYTLINSIESYIKERQVTQRPIYVNVGEIINLTHTQETPKTHEVAVVLENAEPYKGLKAFDFTEKDTKYFHGRTNLTDELLEKICKHNFLAIIGPSGSGKSSVVRAGLLYEINKGQRRSGTEHWKILPIIKPGKHPLLNLAAAFVNKEKINFDLENLFQETQTLLDLFKQKGAAVLTNLVAEFNTSHVVLVVDQFEEVFTRCQGSPEHEQERQQFFECMLGALEQTKG